MIERCFIAVVYYITSKI